MKNVFTFTNLLGFTALAIAGCAAFFSVFGIGALFAGATMSAIIMAIFLEIGKLVGTTFLYRYGKKINGFLKSYLYIAIAVLMLVTSLGIFGYLTSAYQKSSLEYSITKEKIEQLEDGKPELEKQIEYAKTRITSLENSRKLNESRLIEISTNNVSRNLIQFSRSESQINDSNKNISDDIKQENQNIKEYYNGINEINDNIIKLKTDSTNKKDIITFQFIADEFGTDLNTVAKWFIIIIIIVFDPLALVLLIAYNSIIHSNDTNEYQSDALYTKPPNALLTPDDSKSIPSDVSSAPITEPTAEQVTEKDSGMPDWAKRVFKI